MDPRTLPLKRLLVIPSGPPPRAADLAALMARLGVDQAWSDAAVEQLIRAAAAADRWLADHPDDAARLVENPAAVVAAMQQAGLLTGPVDDLLAILEALGRRADADGEPRPALARAAVRVGAKPALRSRPRGVPGSRQGTRTAARDEPRGDEAGR